MEMVRISKTLFKDAGAGISRTLSQILVCPISKQPLRYCEETNSLISDSVGVSFPIVNGVPWLVPRLGKILQNDEAGSSSNAANSSYMDGQERASSKF